MAQKEDAWIDDKILGMNPFKITQKKDVLQ